MASMLFLKGTYISILTYHVVAHDKGMLCEIIYITNC